MTPTLLDEIIQQMTGLEEEYKKSGENKKVHLIKVNPDNYKLLKKEIENITNQPIKTMGRLLNCKVVVIEDLEENFKII